MTNIQPMPEIGTELRSVCFDSVDGTVLRVGEPSRVLKYARRTRESYAGTYIPVIAAIGEAIHVVTGPFSDEEFGRIREVSGAILNSHALSDPRFMVTRSPEGTC